MKIVIGLLCLLLLGVGGAELYVLNQERRTLASEVEALKSRLNDLRAENDLLRADIQYFSNPDNLEKELREKWNYRRPEEKLIIIPD